MLPELVVIVPLDILRSVGSGPDRQSLSFLAVVGAKACRWAIYCAVTREVPVTEQQAVKESADLLRKIIRSIDKRLDYNLIDPTEEGRFSLRLSTRGRAGVVSLLTRDLRSAVIDDVRKNAIRQKIKSIRDNLLSNYVDDVMGRKVARMLTAAARGQSDAKTSFFYRPSRGRR